MSRYRNISVLAEEADLELEDLSEIDLVYGETTTI